MKMQEKKQNKKNKKTKKREIKYKPPRTADNQKSLLELSDQES
jgi:hypothetical protein